MNDVTVTLAPRRAGLRAGADQTLDVLVRIQAGPARNARPRLPLHLAIVLDRSGSMSGPPLEEAKRCAAFIVDRLDARDRVSLVAYDDEVQVLAPCAPMADRETLKRTIARIVEGGSTDLHGGWLTGAESLAAHTAPEALSRVILLSDGCANHGVQDVAQIAAHCSELAQAGVTTSTYGLGRHFNERLMVEMARAGRGNSYYGQTAQDLMDPFVEELDLLAALCARNVRLRLVAAPGVRATVLNDYPALPDGSLRLPDLAHEGEAWALVQLTVPAAALATLNGATPLLQAIVALDTTEGAPLAVETASLSLPVLDAGAVGALPVDELVARRAIEVEAAQIQRRAADAASAGAWHEVKRELARARVLAAEHPWIAAVVEELEELARRRDQAMFAKEALYSSRRMDSRLAALNESASFEQEVAPSFLQRKRSQGQSRERRGPGEAGR
jgi:Ca-activated chloride channel family protein